MIAEHRSRAFKMVPLANVRVLNPRERNQRVFDGIVENIKTVGLKKPVIVTPRNDEAGQAYFLLV